MLDRNFHLKGSGKSKGKTMKNLGCRWESNPWALASAMGSIPGDNQDFSFYSFAFFQTPLGAKVSI